MMLILIVKYFFWYFGYFYYDYVWIKKIYNYDVGYVFYFCRVYCVYICMNYQCLVVYIVFLLYVVFSVVGNSDLFGFYKKFKQVFL